MVENIKEIASFPSLGKGGESRECTRYNCIYIYGWIYIIKRWLFYI